MIALDLHELPLSATHSNWRLFMLRKADPAFARFEEKIFIRDEYNCRFCGFRGKKYMDVVNLDNDFHHNHINNLVTSCSLCSQNFFIESVGRDEYGGGVFIVMPEVTQNELNALCHTLFAAIVSGSRGATQARNIYRSLKLRSQQAEKILGDGMSNPALFGRLLVDVGDETSQAIQKQLQGGIRLLADLQKFAEPVKTWIKEGLNQLETA